MKNKARDDRKNSGRMDKSERNRERKEESRVRLDKPARSALWGTTTLVGKQR
jgi:hypothetical protein